MKKNLNKETENLLDAMEDLTNDEKELVLLNAITKLYGNSEVSVSNIVFKTNNPGIFKKLSGNRKVCGNQRDEIIKSILKIGKVVNPIVVNEKMEVIDGQHRLAALQEIIVRGYPPVEFEFIVVNGLKAEVAVNMNQTMATWKFMDFITYYESLGNENFERLVMLLEKYPEFSLSTLVSVATQLYGSSNNGYSSKIIKNGLLEFSEKDYQKACEELDELKKIAFPQDTPARFKGVQHRDRLHSAILYLLLNGFKTSRFINGFDRADNHLLRTGNFKSCVETAVDVYNSGKGRKRLITAEQLYNNYEKNAKKIKADAKAKLDAAKAAETV